jgi:hypothetical protein
MCVKAETVVEVADVVMIKVAEAVVRTDLTIQVDTATII